MKAKCCPGKTGLATNGCIPYKTYSAKVVWPGELHLQISSLPVCSVSNRIQVPIQTTWPQKFGYYTVPMGCANPSAGVSTEIAIANGKCVCVGGCVCNLLLLQSLQWTLLVGPPVSYYLSHTQQRPYTQSYTRPCGVRNSGLRKLHSTSSIDRVLFFNFLPHFASIALTFLRTYNPFLVHT